MNAFRFSLAAAGSVALLAVGCGSGSSSGTSVPSSSPAGVTGSGASTGSGALVAEAQATAAGDIPDNQVFLTYRNHSAGYSMKYPEGWAVSAHGQTTTIRDKNNLIRIAAGAASRPTVASVRSDLAKLHSQTPSLRVGTPSASPTCAIRGQTRSTP